LKVIVICSRKGGCGKSTISCNLAVTASKNNKRVLLVDADKQNSTLSFRAVRKEDDIKVISLTVPTIHKDIAGFKGFDLAIVDVAGRDDKVFRSALMVSDLVIIPCLPSQFDIWGANDTIDILKEAKSYGKELKAYFLINMLIPNTVVSRESITALSEYKEDVGLLNTILHSRVDYKNCISEGQGVLEYKPTGKASLEMKALYKEIFSLL